MYFPALLKLRSRAIVKFFDNTSLTETLNHKTNKRNNHSRVSSKRVVIIFFQTDFRVFWLLSKMQETPEVQEVSKYNPVSRVVLFHWLVACVLCITHSS